MNCLRCGAKIEDALSFCDRCRQAMEAHPVKPGTPVQIISRPQQEQEKKPSRRKEARKDEANLRLRRIIRWQTVVIGAMTLVICVLCAVLIGVLFAW